MSVLTDEITAVVPTINFPCFVNGVPLIAMLTHIEDNYIQYVYHVTFSDGYKTRILAAQDEANITWVDLNNNDKIEKSADTSYVRAIEADLCVLSWYVPGREVHLNVVDFEDESDVNVWAMQLQESNNYDVYYQNDYRFTLERIGNEWKTYSKWIQNPTVINENLARFICSRIDAKLQ